MSVLLLEDDHLVRATIAEGLRAEGFDVEEAASGAAALSSFERDPQRVTVLVVDVELPGENSGDNVGRQIRRHRPELPMIVTSGRVSSLIEAQRADDTHAKVEAEHPSSAPIGPVHYLIKPYSLPGLVRTIRRFRESKPDLADA